jgi:serine/threonine protein kinase/ATP/maltotriose-dependent transcriptional regulator MalT
MDLIGKTLGQYQIVEQIGQSDATTVFKAYQSALERHVAVKTLTTLTPDLSDRFRAVAQLDHPNILPIIDLGHEDDLYYIVIKLAAGGTLQERLAQALDLNEAVHIVAQVASALDYAHGQGVLHCDLKPSNILLDEENWALLSDFAMVADASASTADYVSPEQGQGLEVDQRSDVYALGAILYHMLTGQPPFQAPTPMAVIVQHATQPLTTPSQINPDLPQAVEEVVCKALAKAPDERYASAGEMARALQEAVPAAPAAAPGAQPENGKRERTHLSQLRQILEAHFDQDELQTFCFELGVDYDNLPGEGHGNKAREMLDYLARHSRLPELLTLGQGQRPDIAWDDVQIPQDAAPPASLRQALVQRFDEGELRTLYFDLGIGYDSLPGEGTDDKARELILYLVRHDRLPELLDLGMQLRPDIPWDDLSVEVQDVSAPPRPAVPPDVSGFVGREDELAYFADKLTSSRMAVISGMAGMGKTALAAVLTQQLAQPAQVFWHTFHRDEGVEVLLYKLAGFLFWRGQEDMWRMLHGVQQSGGEPPPTPVLLDYLFQAVCGQHCLLCLDDWQLVEQEPLLEQLLERLREAASQGDLSLLVVSQSVPQFVRADEFQTLDGLSLPDTTQLLAQHGLIADKEQALKAKVHSTSTLLQRQDLMSADIIANLHARTAGNPRFLTLAADALKRTSTPARFIARVFATRDVERFLMQEVDDNLSEDERAVMSAVATLLGYPGTRYAIEAALDGENVRRMLSELAQRNLLEMSEGDEGREYNMNPVMRHFYYDLLSKRQRREAHQRLGEYYEREEPDALKAARHYQQAGEHEQAAQLATSDVRALINQGQARALSQLLQSFEAEHLQAVSWAWVNYGRGRVYTFLRASELAQQSLQEALSTLAALPDGPATQELRAYTCHGMGNLLEHEAPPQALDWLKRGLEELGQANREEQASLQIHISSVHIAMGNYDTALKAVQKGLDLLPAGPSQTRASALIDLGTIHALQGDIEKGNSYTLQALEIAQQLHDHFCLAKIWYNLGFDCFDLDDWPGAAANFEQALKLAKQLGNVSRQVNAQNMLGALHTKLGDYDVAGSYLSQAYTLAQDKNLRHYLPYILKNLADLLLRQGEWEAAEIALDEAEPLALEMETKYPLVDLYACRARACLGRGEAEAALELAECSLALAREMKLKAEQGRSLRVLGQALCARGQTQDALEIFEKSLALLANTPYGAARTKVPWGLALLEGGNVEQGTVLLQEARAAFADLGAERDLAAVEKALAPL